MLVLAAALRLLDLPTRGTWDADQGTDMAVLHALVTEGRFPLLGPKTSIGDFHHGVLYYYLLAPSALLSGADPLAAVATIALAGIAAVAAVWWLARSIGGPVAGLVAAAAIAISASAIEESTFIWNPNFIALSSAVSLAAAWRAWTTGRARWWVLAGAAQVVTMHCHVLGSVMLLPLAAAWAVALQRRQGSAERRRTLVAGGIVVALIAVSYVPLLTHELGSGFSETRAALDFLAGRSGGEGAPLLVRLLVVPLRVLSWPLTGLITNQPLAGVAAAAIVVVIAARRIRSGSRRERMAVVWLGATLLWASAALIVGASSLGSVIPGLPNDHYHSFLDPIVFTLVGLGVAALWRRGRIGRAIAGAALAALVAINVAIWPPSAAPDGGYPRAEQAARAIVERTGDAPIELVGLPTGVKNANAYAFPLRRLGANLATDGAETLVVACDRLLEPIIGAACNGPAEDRHLADDPRELVTRFDASPRTVISIYR